MIEVYTEYTPNPESLKFVVNKMLLAGNSVDFRSREQVSDAPLAEVLFEKPYVQGVFIANNFVTITKSPDLEWLEIASDIRNIIKTFVQGDQPAVMMPAPPPAQPSSVGADVQAEGLEAKIRSVLETYVKPAVEMDGGNIQFKSYAEGRVTVVLQGSCSGCPSSTMTLKSGIENLLSRMIPEVREVVAEAG